MAGAAPIDALRSYREAREALPALAGKATKHTLARTTNERPSEYLPRWLSNHERNISEKVRYDYRHTIDKHILPALGGSRLKDLEPEDIEDYLRARLDAGLSATSIHHHFTLLHRVLEGGSVPLSRKIEPEIVDEVDLRVVVRKRGDQR